MKETTMHIITVLGSLVAIASLGIIAKHLVDDVRARRQMADDRLRTDELVKMARILYPGANDITALDFLYQKFYKDIVIAKRLKSDMSQLVRDHILVLNERLRLIAEEVENTSQFTRLRAVARV
jgi:hypothetical protein